MRLHLLIFATNIMFYNTCNTYVQLLQKNSHPQAAFKYFRKKKSYVFLSKFQMLQIAILGWQKRVAPFPKLQLPYMVWRWLVSLVIVPDQKKIGDTMTLALKLVFYLQIRNRFQLHLSKGVTSETSISFHERKQKYIYDFYDKRHSFFSRNTWLVNYEW